MIWQSSKKKRKGRVMEDEKQKDSNKSGEKMRGESMTGRTVLPGRR